MGLLSKKPTTGRWSTERTGQVALVTLLVLYVVGRLLLPEHILYVNLLLVDTANVVAAALMAHRSRRLGRRGRAWSWFALAMVSHAVGDILESVVELGWLSFATQPSVSDIFWLGFYGCAAAGIASMIQMQPRRTERSAWLDGLVSGLGALAINAAVALDPATSSVSTNPLVIAVTLAYPVLDVLLALMLVVGLGGWRRGKSVAFLLLGLAMFGIGDTLYLNSLSANGYALGDNIDLFWLLGIVAFGLAATVGIGRNARHEWEDENLTVFPLTFAVGAVLVILVDRFRSLHWIALVLAGATLVSVAVRAKTALRDLGELASTRREARTDELTLLPNRRSFTEMIALALDRASISESPLAVVMIDLDGFKVVNDTLGHHRGDELLREVARRFDESIAEGDILARLGGDEFGLVVHPSHVPGWAHGAGRRLLDALEHGFELDGLRLHVKASVGIALYPDDGDTPETLLQRSDVAMYEAKRSGSGVRFYSSDFDRNSRDKLKQLDELRHGISEEQLVLHYQPKVRFADGVVTGVEALVRWQHPARGLLGPGDFLPVAVSGGLLPHLTRQVVMMAFEQGGRWHTAGKNLGIAVNVGSADLIDEAFPPMVSDLVRRYGLPHGMVTIEITEDSVIADPVRTAEVVSTLRGLGLRVSVDDFGAGYASLSHLRELDVDELKLDKSLVDGVESDRKQQALVRSAVGMAQALGLKLVAEGVETVEGWNKLKELQCDIAQGYLVSKPLSEAALERWLSEHVGTAEIVPSARVVMPPIDRRQQRRRPLVSGRRN